MLTPEATAARTASDPEWASVPSPMFWTKCSRDTNGDMPFHIAPSPPIWNRPTTVPDWRGFIWMASPWQPLPDPAMAPSGSLTEVLCGQPEQK